MKEKEHLPVVAVDTSMMFDGLFPSLDNLAKRFCKKYGYHAFAKTEKETEDDYAYWDNSHYNGEELLRCGPDGFGFSILTMIIAILLDLDAKLIDDWTAAPTSQSLPIEDLSFPEFVIRYGKLTERQEVMLSIIRNTYNKLFIDTNE